MKVKRSWKIIGVAGIGLGLAAATGCQTNVAGMTLPSGHYLQHPPQYFPPSPAFPLQKELAAMEAQTAGQAGAVAPAPAGQVAPLVPPVVPGGGLVPGQPPPPLP
jgi:hypothetical protein